MPPSRFSNLASFLLMDAVSSAARMSVTVTPRLPLSTQSGYQRVRWHLTFVRRAVVHLLKVEGISIFLLTQSLTTTIYICETRTLITTPRSCLPFLHKGAPTSTISALVSCGGGKRCEISVRTCTHTHFATEEVLPVHNFLCVAPGQQCC